jgi:hypothetical protein
VVIRPSRIGEVDVDHGEVSARDEPDDVRSHADLDRLTFVSRPLLDTPPPSDSIVDLDVGRVDVSVGVWDRGFVEHGVEPFPLSFGWLE